MVREDDLDQRCRQCVEGLSRSEGWGLSESDIDRYAAAIVARVPAELLERNPEQTVRNYYQWHRHVAAFSDEGHPDHVSTWQWAANEIRRVAQIKRLHWSSDRSVELDDILQTAQIELSRAIGAYRYESSLRTWLQSVVVRRLLRFHRDTQAEKRAARPAPLDDAEQVPATANDPELQAQYAALCERVERILGAAGDERLVRIFRLRYIEDRSAEEISQALKLHPSRIRALLKQLREILAQDEEMRQWVNDDNETTV